MYKDLFYQSPLLALPVVAMFLFLAVYLVVTIRATLAPRSEVDAVARLPLGDDHGRL